MNEAEEKLLDTALMEQLQVDPYLKLSTGIALVVHRQLLLLCKEMRVPVESMDREFLVENLCKVKVTESARRNAVAQARSSKPK
jgi:hypothetical protein